MSVPTEIPGLGSSTQKIRPNPTFDPMKAGIGPEEYFVLSRIDGALTLREVLLMTGLPIERAIEMVIRLRDLGAILLPGETPMSAPRPTATGSGTQRAVTNTPLPERLPDRNQPLPERTTSQPERTHPRGTAGPRSTNPTNPGAAGRTGRIPRQPSASEAVAGRSRDSRLTTEAEADVPDDTLDLDRNLDSPTKEELAALAEVNALTDDERRLILAMARRLGWGDSWSLIGLPPDADKRRVKRAYFKLSKEFHPDRYYGRKLGSFKPLLDKIFEELSRAYADLTDPKPKDGSRPARRTGEAQSPIEYAGELFERACENEVHGNPLEAMKQFAAAIRIDPQVKYLRRAARCALSAGQPRTAEEYANKATNLDPSDLSTSRLLAAAFRAQNKLDAAEEVLVMALAVPSKNDALVTELRRDLAEIRRALGG